MDTINRNQIENYATTMSLPDEAWKTLCTYAAQISMSISEFLILCLKCSAQNNQIQQISERPTVSYNNETCAVIKKIYLTREEHHTLQSMRNILKLSVSCMAAIAIMKYAEKIATLLEKEKSSKNSWIIEKWRKRVELELMFISREIVKMKHNLFEFRITITQVKGRMVNIQELSQKLMENYSIP